MRCEQARQLFDAYLDGELSPSLATELGAHRLRCPDCRQALALLEVSGHILKSDRDPVRASDDFTDRLLACVDTVPVWRRRVLNAIYVGGPLAAAAVIALAFIGVFDGKGPSQVAGVKQVVTTPMIATDQPAKAREATPAVKAPAPVDPAEEALAEYFEQTQKRMKDQGESVQRVLDLTVLQMLEILEEAKDRHSPRLESTKTWDRPSRSEPHGSPFESPAPGNEADGDSPEPAPEDESHPE